MLSSPPPEAQHLAHAWQTVDEQLRQLDGYTPVAGQPLQLSGLFAALDEYQQAVQAYLPAWQHNPHPTAEELLTEREASPLYRLGWVRGYKRGQVDAQRKNEPVVSRYAQHAQLPTPPDPSALVQQVRRFLAEMHRRYGAGPITAGAPRSSS